MNKVGNFRHRVIGLSGTLLLVNIAAWVWACLAFRDQPVLVGTAFLFINPVRKLYYNLTITFVSVVVAVIVGGIEVAGLLKEQLNLYGGFWTLVENLNDNFGMLGIVIVGVCVLTWIVSAIVYQVKRLDLLE
jgi:high-affinity nickel permease